MGFGVVYVKDFTNHALQMPHKKGALYKSARVIFFLRLEPAGEKITAINRNQREKPATIRNFIATNVIFVRVN